MLCGQAIGSDTAVVATLDGGLVHIRCADQDAKIAWRLRLAHSLLCGPSIAALTVMQRAGDTVDVLAVTCVGLLLSHFFMHRAWWRRVFWRSWRYLK